MRPECRVKSLQNSYFTIKICSDKNKHQSLINIYYSSKTWTYIMYNKVYVIYVWSIIFCNQEISQVNIKLHRNKPILRAVVWYPRIIRDNGSKRSRCVGPAPDSPYVLQPDKWRGSSRQASHIKWAQDEVSLIRSPSPPIWESSGDKNPLVDILRTAYCGLLQTCSPGTNFTVVCIKYSFFPNCIWNLGACSVY